MQAKNLIKELPTHTKTIKIDVRTWITLKNLKKENETFNDVIKDLLRERTMSVDKGNVKAIKYSRKILFINAYYSDKNIGLEFEYNDVKSQQTDFALDLAIKKIFYGKKIFNPSIFFGLDAKHKHLSPLYLNIYLRCILIVLQKEFGVVSMYDNKDFEDIALWRKIYYEYHLSQESFIHDIEEPLRLSEEEPLTEEYKKRINESISASIWNMAY